MTKQKPTIILDWDGTLFDTVGFWYDLGLALTNVGVSRANWQKVYDSQPDGLIRLDRLVEDLKPVASASDEKIRKVIDRQLGEALWYLHADTRAFLEYFKPRANLVLLSYGDEALQSAKLAQSGISGYFDQIHIVDQPKPEIRTLPVSAVHQAIFINDDIAETRDMATSFRWARHLHVNRSNRQTASDFQFPSFPDLRQLGAALQPLVDVEG